MYRIKWCEEIAAHLIGYRVYYSISDYLITTFLRLGHFFPSFVFFHLFDFFPFHSSSFVN